MKYPNFASSIWPRLTSGKLRIPNALINKGLRVGLIVLSSLGVGLAVIISTYYANNVKLLIGLIGGVAFVFLTMRWPEFSIMSLVAILSGLIPLGSLPSIHLGPISLQITDFMLFLLLGLVFLRATTQSGFVLFGSPLTLPLLLFIGAFLISAINAVLISGVSPNTVLRTVRVLIVWIVFIPTLQLVRDEKALRRLLVGLLIFTGLLLFGVLFPNKLSPVLYIEEAAQGMGTRIYYSGDMVLYAMIPVTVASLAMIKKGKQLWRIGLLGLLFYWVFRTYFREYWLTLLTVCIILVFFFTAAERKRLLKRMTPAIIVGALIVGVFMTSQPTQVERMVQPLIDRVATLGKNPLNEASLQWRQIENYYALQQINRHPVFGLGLGYNYRPPMIAESEEMYNGWASTYVENGYLYITVMMGLVGLIPFLWLCVAYLLRVFRHQYEIRDEGLRAIYLGFGAAFLGMAACNITSPTFVIETRLVFFPLSMAICEVILRLERERRVSQ